MPELPEVETVMRGMQKEMLGETLKEVSVHIPKLRWAVPEALGQIENEKIVSFKRRSKYVLITLETGKVILIHLGMSGRILFDREELYTRQKHDHILFFFGDGQIAIYNDPRRFGMVDLIDEAELANSFYMQKLGPEPLSEAFTAVYLYKALTKSRLAVKTAIMQSKLVVGVGNIYASESLFAAGIDPRKLACNLTKQEVDRLYTCVVKVLQDAIASGGSTLKDYVQADGSLGYFQHSFQVYGREGEPCKACETPIKRVVLNQRSTFYCEKCQS